MVDEKVAPAVNSVMAELQLTSNLMSVLVAVTVRVNCSVLVMYLVTG